MGRLVWVAVAAATVMGACSSSAVQSEPAPSTSATSTTVASTTTTTQPVDNALPDGASDDPAKLEHSNWRITVIDDPDGHHVVDRTLTMTLAFTVGKFSFRACNSGGGAINIRAGVLLVDSLQSTTMACVERNAGKNVPVGRGYVEHALFDVIGGDVPRSATSWYIDRRGALHLVDAAGTTRMGLVPITPAP